MKKRAISSGNKSGNDEVKRLVRCGYHGPPELLKSRKRRDFFIKPLYQNTLPDVPCDPKHILTPVDPLKFEIPPKDLSPFYEQLFDNRGGVTVDLVGSTQSWKLPSVQSVELNRRDKILLEDDFVKEKDSTAKRSNAHKTSVTWLRRTEYISSEPAKFKTQHSEKLEYRVDKAINKKLKSEAKWEEIHYLKDRKARINSIEESFELSSKPVMEHHAKPGVFAEEVIPVFPDFDLWRYPFVEIVFDTSPSASVNLGKIDETQMKDAVLAAMPSKEEQEDVERLGYFVPCSSSHVAFTETDDTGEYLLSREYIFKKGTKNLSWIDDTCVFIEKEGSLTYCEINKRMNLNRSIKADSQSSFRGAKLTVTYRSPNQQERQIWQKRENSLKPIDLSVNNCTNSTIVSDNSAEVIV